MTNLVSSIRSSEKKPLRIDPLSTMLKLIQFPV
jgi:hypothetical protein